MAFGAFGAFGPGRARTACRDTSAAFEPLQVVERAFHTSATTIENVRVDRVDHRPLHVVVPQQLLNRPDVAASHQQVRGEGMTQRMASGPLVDPRRYDRRPHRPLHQRLVVVVLEVPAGRAVEGAVPRRKHPLPRPGLPDARVLAGCGQTACSIAGMRSRVRGTRENRRFSSVEKRREDFFHGQLVS